MPKQNTEVFRKVSLDRLASPEQLDQLMQVTDAKGWIVLAAIGTVLLTALTWGVIGRLPENVGGMGILVKSGGVFEVVPMTSGRVIDLAVAVGDSVTEGQVVARIDQPDLSDRLQGAKATLHDLRAQSAQVNAYGGRDLALQRQSLAQQRTNIEQTIASAEQTATWLAEKIESQDRLVQEGLLTKPTLIATKQQHDQMLERVRDGKDQLTQISVKQLEIENQRSNDSSSSRVRVEEQERRVAELERELKAKQEITAPYTGRILEIMADRGSVVGAGEPILSLDLTGRAVKDLEAVIYVPSSHGKQIRPGMEIQISPSTVKKEEFGLMVGRVTYVSDFPATSKGMTRVLKNERLVSGLSGQDAPYEIHADLVVDPTTASRYRWSSSKGPPVRIQSGTLAGANIIVAEKRPIELVIPLVRKYTGI
jgi:HlyD family secretion protein